MLNLSAIDRNTIVALLAATPEIAREQDRINLLESAGISKELIGQIDLSGARNIAAAAIVRELVNFGRPTPEAEALGMLLNWLKARVGSEQQDTIDYLLDTYAMMVPVVGQTPPRGWRGGDTAGSVAEKIIGENTLRPIAFLERGLDLARAVAQVRVNQQGKSWTGTGFLVGPSLLLTNHHVLPSRECLAYTSFRFNYQTDATGHAIPVSELRPASDGAYHANADLDYALVQLEGEPGLEWGWITLEQGLTARDQRATIIQHPGGGPKQISFQNNFVVYAGPDLIQYVTSTEPGSSGSPVFNDDWQLIALHHAGGVLVEPGTERHYFRNEGIRIARILADLPAALHDGLRAATVS